MPKVSSLKNNGNLASTNVIYCLQGIFFLVIFDLSQMQTIICPNMIALCSNIIEIKINPVLKLPTDVGKRDDNKTKA